MSDSKAQSGASRRHALKLLGAAPMLPLGGLAFLTACGGGGGGGTSFPFIPPAPAPSPAPAPAPAANFVSAEFGSMAAPSLADAAAMATTTVGSTLKVSFDNGSSTEYKLAYQPFFLTGDMVSDGKGGKVLAGGYVDINNKPIIDASVAGKERQFFSDAPDGSSLLTVPNASVPGVKGKPVFAVVQFEYTTKNQAGASTYGQLPSPIAVLTLDQDQATGKLSLVKYHNVDMSSAHGLWITCGASLSPWGTHLSSEEYEPDAFTASGNAQFKAYSKNVFGSETTAKAYHYGHLPEVTVNPDGTGSVKKHYCLGRISHELIQVMPDNRTALMGDDYTNGGLFMFVADKEKDLSAGTLYVAKVGAGFSIDPAAAGADLTWIKLGHATSAEIEALANTVAPTDIMDVKFADPADASYTKIFADGVAQWVKLVPGMEKAAAFLETHRYANLVGASMAFTKMEGTTVNAKDKIAYSALANIQSSMVKDNAAWRADLNVTVAKALVAGGVMAHNLTGGQKDTGGTAINSEWVPVKTKALIVGEDLDTPDNLGNNAHADKIASPDNIKFSEKMRTLFIGEDSGNHVNNFLWAYNVDTKKLSRILSTPTGAECTGLHAVDEINGWTYIMSNFQHPGEFIKTAAADVKSTLGPLVKANYNQGFSAVVGYLTADPIQPKLAK
ncbi:PhoX family protein [Variovorax sp. W2I14]|uniref:PhoX family protein n=1 Tax=Variovorax sp. W2I14 TaxID=3042290 RepID=UPI003D234FEE